MRLSKWQVADLAINAYDAYVMTGNSALYEAWRADLLAEDVIALCEIASRDKTVSQGTRNYYKARCDEFKCIIGA